MIISLLLTFLLAEPSGFHQPPRPPADPQSTVVLLARARAILDRLHQEPPTRRELHKSATPTPPTPPFDMAAIVKPFFTYEGVAPLAPPQQSDSKTQ